MRPYQLPTHLCAAALLVVSVSRTSATQRSTDAGGFITRLGTDTIAVERYTRSASRIEGDIAIRNPRTRTVHYVATLDAAGTITRFEMASSFVTAPAGTPPLIERQSTITDTTLTNEVRRNGVRDTTASGAAALPRKGAVPFVQSGIVFFEQMARELRQSHGDSLEIPQFTFAPSAVFPSYARAIGKDSMELNVGVPLYAKVDKTGRLLGISARATTVKTETVRVPSLDLTTIVAAWVAREKAGNIAGAVSGRDTVRATVGPAELWLDYGRPLRRGRAIFGALVPWDTVWRTGANAATQFRTSADLVIGGSTVPAGIYTLWTIPSRNGAMLVVNKQSGQWGTQYDSTQDLVRIPVRVSTVAQPVEKFTMELPSGSGASTLRFTWDTRQFFVPIVVK